MDLSILAFLATLVVYSIGFLSGALVNDRNRREDIRRLIEQHEADRKILVKRFMLGQFKPGQD